jgi:hypothetical protein
MVLTKSALNMRRWLAGVLGVRMLGRARRGLKLKHRIYAVNPFRVSGSLSKNLDAMINARNNPSPRRLGALEDT